MVDPVLATASAFLEAVGRVMALVTAIAPAIARAIVLSHGTSIAFVIGLGFWVVPSSHMLKTEYPCHFCGKGFSGATVRDIG